MQQFPGGTDNQDGSMNTLSMPPPVPVMPISSPDGTSTNQSDLSTDNT